MPFRNEQSHWEAYTFPEKNLIYPQVFSGNLKLTFNKFSQSLAPPFKLTAEIRSLTVEFFPENRRFWPFSWEYLDSERAHFRPGLEPGC